MNPATRPGRRARKAAEDRRLDAAETAATRAVDRHLRAENSREWHAGRARVAAAHAEPHYRCSDTACRYC